MTSLNIFILGFTSMEGFMLR